MKKFILQILIITLLLIGCNVNKNISLTQVHCEECFINLSFYKKNLNKGSLILKKKITVVNPYLKQMKFRINYYKANERIFSAYAYSNWFIKVLNSKIISRSLKG